MSLRNKGNRSQREVQGDKFDVLVRMLTMSSIKSRATEIETKVRRFLKQSLLQLSGAAGSSKRGKERSHKGKEMETLRKVLASSEALRMLYIAMQVLVVTKDGSR